LVQSKYFYVIAPLEGIPENMCQRVEKCDETLSHLRDAQTSIEEAIEKLESAVER